MTLRSSRSMLRGFGLAMVAAVAVIAGLLVAAEPAGAAAAPAVRSVSPTSGKTSGGTRVTLTGTGFTNVRSVKFGVATGTSISVLSSTNLAVTAPAHAAGGVDVRVTTASGTSAIVAADRYTYVAPPAVTSVSPTSGKTAAGTRVTITGARFLHVTSVKFGIATGTSISVLSSTKLAVTAPAHAAGGVDVRVTTTYGTSPIVTADRYTYVAPPTVTAVSPTLGGTGGATRVTLTGTNFIRVTGVTFGGVRGSSVSVSSSTKLAVTAPAHAAGLVDIRVITSYGTSPAVAADRFTYVPSLTSGVAVHPVISIAGQQIRYVFAGVSGRHVTFDISSTTWVDSPGVGSAYLRVYNPNGGLVASRLLGSEPGHLDFTPTATGTYAVYVMPNGDSTGDATITYATDLVGGALTSTVPVNPVLAYRGRWAYYTFAGVLGQHVTFDISSTTWVDSPGTGSAYLRVYNPNGGLVASRLLGSQPGHLDLTPTATGTYAVYVMPNGESTGNATITYATDVIGGALTSTVPVNPVLAYRGRWVHYTFAGVLGQHVTFDVSATTWVDSPGVGSAYLRVYNPSGGLVAARLLGSEPGHLDFTPTATGTYAVYVMPNGESTGNATITYVTDLVGGALTSTVPVNPVLAYRGRWAHYTFAGVLGQHVTFDISSTTWVDSPGVGGRHTCVSTTPMADSWHRGCWGRSQGIWTSHRPQPGPTRST